MTSICVWYALIAWRLICSSSGSSLNGVCDQAMSERRRIHLQVRLVPSRHRPELPTMNYPISHLGKLGAPCHGANLHQARGAVIRV